MILAIDPGTERSAVLAFDEGRRSVDSFALMPNAEVVSFLASVEVDVLAYEMFASYGMPVGAEVFETCVWIGRFLQAWGKPARRLYRSQVKMHLCGNCRAKDSNVRQALIDKFGPGHERAIGTKAAPGPLYGMTGDEWSALAIAVTAAEKPE